MSVCYATAAAAAFHDVATGLGDDVIPADVGVDDFSFLIGETELKTLRFNTEDTEAWFYMVGLNELMMNKREYMRGQNQQDTRGREREVEKRGGGRREREREVENGLGRSYLILAKWYPATVVLSVGYLGNGPARTRMVELDPKVL